MWLQVIIESPHIILQKMFFSGMEKIETFFAGRLLLPFHIFLVVIYQA